MSLDIRLIENRPVDVHEANITHNLAAMAKAAGLYRYLWRPEELGITKASELIEPLREGLRELRNIPDIYAEYNPANGWGSYDILVQFVEEYLEACVAHPDATVEVSR